MAAFDWKAVARAIYRSARAQLPELRRRATTIRRAYYLDELEEALFDLKEATISGDDTRAERHIEEITSLLSDLRQLLDEDES